MTKKSDRPQELSSKSQVPHIKPIPLLSKKKKSRDPRFEEASGYLNTERFQNSYHWMRDLKRKEIDDVKRQYQKEKDATKRAQLKSYIDSEESRIKSSEKQRETQQILKERMKLESELVTHGKAPFYLKKADQKKLVLIEQYKRTKEGQSGMGGTDLDHTLEKRRQRTASRQHKKLPSRNLKE